MKPVTGRPTNVRIAAAPTVCAWSRVVVRVELRPPAPTPAAPVLVPVNVALAQPFWKLFGTGTCTALREPSTPELLPAAPVCVVPLRNDTTVDSQHRLPMPGEPDGAGGEKPAADGMMLSSSRLKMLNRAGSHAPAVVITAVNGFAAGTAVT